MTREEAIYYLGKVEYMDANEEDALRMAIEALSAEANPTVVRCKTMIPYGDFREWAKRIREDNPNVIVIPFDAEVASAEAIQVVRCKNCKHRSYGGWCDIYIQPRMDTDFCNYGERKGGEENGNA